jgi:uncharacterized membrane protein YGL010W
MKSLNDHLAQYASYHLDPRNVSTHYVGIPMIVVAVAILLSRPVWEVSGLAVTPALLVALLSVVFYLRLDVRFALAMAVQLALSVWIGHWAAAQSTGTWLVWGVGLFVVGWALQFIGHVFEGRKPAFVDDLVGLLVGPLFITAKLAFALGMRAEVKQEVERRLTLR